MQRAVAALILSCLVLPLTLRADAVLLTSGQVLEGKILAEDEKRVVIRTPAGDLEIPRRDILKLEKPGGDKIARLNPDKLSPERSALYSLIPFYSGLYRTSEPGLGVPVAMLSGYYALKLFETVARKVPFTAWQSDSGRRDFYRTVAGAVVVRQNQSTTYNPLTDPEIIYIPLYDVLRLWPVHGFKVGDKFYTKDALADFRRRTAQRLVAALTVNAAITWAYVRFLGEGGVTGFFSSVEPGPSGLQLRGLYALPQDPDARDRGQSWEAGAVFSF